MYMYMYFEVRKFSVRMPVQLYLKLLRLQGTILTKVLNLVLPVRYVSLPTKFSNWFVAMSARGSGRTWRRTNQALRQPTGFRAELYAEELRTATPKEFWNTRVYCARCGIQDQVPGYRYGTATSIL